MRILHIGDFHYKPNSNNYDQELMISKIIENLITKDPINLILFTGDLVHSGSNINDFEEAHQSLFAKLSNALNVPLSNIITCPGNHDIRREESIKAIVNYFDNEIVSSNQLYDEIEKKTTEYYLSLKPSENYYTYIKTHYSEYLNEHNELYQITQKNIDGKKIAIVSINSAWLSSGHREDLNLLMYPITVLKNIILKIRDSHCKILLIHHPLNYFKEFNYIELEDFIHKHFDLMFSGHIHKEQITTKYSGYNGIYSNTSQATLSFDKSAEIGFSVINTNPDDPGKLIIERSHYIPKENIFFDLESVHIQIPLGAEKAQQNNLRAKITSKLSSELTNANELLLDYDEENGSN